MPWIASASGVLVDEDAFAAAGVEHTRASREARRATSGRRSASRCRWGSSPSPDRARDGSRRGRRTRRPADHRRWLHRDSCAAVRRPEPADRAEPPPPPPPVRLACRRRPERHWLLRVGGGSDPGRGAVICALRLPGLRDCACGIMPRHAAASAGIDGCGWLYPGGIADASSISGIAAASARFTNGCGADCVTGIGFAPGGWLKGRIMMRSNTEAPATGVGALGGHVAADADRRRMSSACCSGTSTRSRVTRRHQLLAVDDPGLTDARPLRHDPRQRHVVGDQRDEAVADRELELARRGRPARKATAANAECSSR